MAKMQKLELKVVRFSAEDVIATSGIPSAGMLSNFGDGNVGNNTWTIGGTTYSPGSNQISDLQAALGEDGSADVWHADNEHSVYLGNLWNAGGDDNGEFWAAFNGSYSWQDGYAWYKEN